MHLLQWVDNRTLLACQCIVAGMFSIALLGMRRLYPHLRGIESLAIGFFYGIAATMLLGSFARNPSLRTALGAHLTLTLSYICLYHGILRFNGGALQRLSHGYRPDQPLPPKRDWFQGHLPLLYTVAVISTLLITLFLRRGQGMAPVIFLTCSFVGLARILMARLLFRHAGRRLHMRLFAWSLLAFSGISLERAAATLWFGAPTNLLQFNELQTLTLLASFLFICLNGMFYLTMVAYAVATTIEEQSQLDFLTGALNRRGMDRALSIEAARTSRGEHTFSVLVLDIDRFKVINDTHGHAAGDEALCRVAAAIGLVVRIYDKLSRYGGDEFLLLLPETDGEEAMAIASRIRQTLRSIEDDREPAKRLELTLSIGGTFCLPGEGLDDLLARADRALYEAKRGGRDRACLEAPFWSRPASRPVAPEPDEMLSASNNAL
jgi:diguanylate cyclase (GGDEF)-like protein